MAKADLIADPATHFTCAMGGRPEITSASQPIRKWARNMNSGRPAAERRH